ncbi:hypothetical protein FSP39_007384 [Pinctada imbricata]|uniref:VIT domain-containing protein n=1 Tax=Pinctada imbricata TaxID=66713 RepID=A0AA88XU33_PINIB|nr:hypothetical protein FSP39_007384 [Pinctada imbricata]
MIEVFENIICDNFEHKIFSVSLKEIKTEVSIKEFIANVESKLEYFNRGPVAVEAEFVFPLDSKTAVYNFEAEINGRHIVAECQEQAEAIETYKDAIDSGHSAMLLSEEGNAGDVFKLRLGNLDAHSKAVLTFSYVVELDVEVHGSVRFTLPTVLCPRYTPGKYECTMY